MAWYANSSVVGPWTGLRYALFNVRSKTNFATHNFNSIPTDTHITYSVTIA
jgi:hypothetical protein